jgi:hypothetical protein
MALTAGLVSIVPAAAAPDNKNTTSFEVNCDEPIGDVTVSENGQGQGDTVVFTQDGQVLVAKGIVGTSDATLAIESGPTIPLGEESFEDGIPGSGFEDRLVSCDVTIEFEDTFRLSKKFAEFLELPEFAGALATVTGTLDGMAEVIVPGG